MDSLGRTVSRCARMCLTLILLNFILSLTSLETQKSGLSPIFSSIFVLEIYFRMKVFPVGSTKLKVLEIWVWNLSFNPLSAS